MSSVPHCFDISSVILLAFLHSQVDDFVLIKNCFRHIIVAIVIIFFNKKTNIEKKCRSPLLFLELAIFDYGILWDEPWHLNGFSLDRHLVTDQSNS